MSDLVDLLLSGGLGAAGLTLAANGYDRLRRHWRLKGTVSFPGTPLKEARSFPV